MSDLKNAPPVSDALLEYLERTFPDTVPDESEGFNVFLTRIGTQRVIRHLRRIQQLQTVGALTPTKG